MPFSHVLGRIVSLAVSHLTPHGAYLAVPPPEGLGQPGTVLLPSHELAPDIGPGSTLSVFVYLDSDDRPIATRVLPKLSLGEAAFVEVTDLAHFGAFVDIGLRKDLLVPLAEQTTAMRIGERHAIAMIIDRSGRLAGTARLSELLTEVGSFQVGEWVEGEAWRKEPGIGIFVILERRFVALLPESEPNALTRGEAARFRISHVHTDGKVEVSLRQLAHSQIDDDADALLRALERQPALRLGDHSPPQVISEALGISKKAFKRAAGRLLREGTLAMDRDGHFTLRPLPKSK